MGDIQEARGDNLAAMTSFQQAVALAPTEERYRLSLALEFIRHKNFDAAKAVLQQAKDLHPDSWRISFALGMVEYFAGNEETASGILLHAAKLSPDPPVALKYLGDIQMDRAAGPDPRRCLSYANMRTFIRRKRPCSTTVAPCFFDGITHRRTNRI